jgi:hypothetical protein
MSMDREGLHSQRREPLSTDESTRSSRNAGRGGAAPKHESSAAVHEDYPEHAPIIEGRSALDFANPPAGA